MPVTLYKRQKQILDFINQYIQKYNCSPTLQQIADAINVNSLATIHEHLKAMEKKGVIRRYEGAVRGIEVVDNRFPSNLSSVELPILGYIAAGSPIEVYNDPNATVQVSQNILSGRKSAFVLQVKGESMIGEGILDGDFVVIERQEEANNGDIVVAILNDGFATLKKYYKEASRIRLEPANSKMLPIFAKDVKIQGKVVGIIRRFQP
jgi:repressor LexA